MSEFKRREDFELLSDAAINAAEHGSKEMAYLFFVFAGRIAIAETARLEPSDAA